MSRTTSYIAAALCLGMLAVASRALIYSLDRSYELPEPHRNARSAEPPPPGASGSLAPDIAFTPAAGSERVRLSDLRGKPLILAFGSCT